MKHPPFWILLGLALSVTAGGCGGGKPRLNGAGSTFVFPMLSKWAAEYDQARGVEVNYQSIGSGGGVRQMTAHTADFGCTDAPMNDEELREARNAGGDVIHIPLVMGAVVPAYNLPDVKEPLVFSGPVLADIFLGKITRWDDPALRALNPGVTLPDKAIGVVHRSDGSGTTYVFADYLAKVSPEWKQRVGVANALKWPAGEGAKGNEGVSGRVKAAPGNLGYIELTYALQNKISFGSVKNRAGKVVRADVPSVTAAVDSSLKEIPDDLRFSITDAPGEGAYPISGTVWAVLYARQPAGKGQHVVDFLRWVTHEGQSFCEGLDYVRLPAGLVERVEKKLASVQIQ